MIREQIRQKIVAFENQAKSSKINSVFKWWSKCISMVIAKTASRNVVYKANKLGESMFARQSEMLMPEEELGCMYIWINWGHYTEQQHLAELKQKLNPALLPD